MSGAMRRRASPFLVLPLVACAAASWACRWSEPAVAPSGADAPRAAPAEVAIGTRIDLAALAFVDSRYLPRRGSELGEAQAYAFVFSANDCPIAQRYLPTLAELERAYRPRGVCMVLVNVGPADTLADACAQAAAAGLECQVVKDFEAALVAALGVRRTPEVAVLDAQGGLRYRGRIDDQQRLGGVQPAVGRAYLREALDALLAHAPIATAQTDVEGCAITRHVVAPDPQLGWREHVRPLFQTHCASCHVRGGSAPFELSSYLDVKRRAAMIEEVVAQQRMPPWYAAASHGAIINELVLGQAERERIVAWLRAGAPEGEGVADPVETPPRSGWTREPDLVLEAEHPITVPASGVFPFQLVRVPFALDEDVWVSGIEIRPSDPRAMHHGFLGAQEDDTPDPDMSTAAYLHMYVPGGSALELPPGLGLRIPARHFLWLQLHYVPNGVELTDSVSIGLHFPRSPIRKELFGTDLRTYDIEIPPGHPAYGVSGARTIPWNITLYGAFPHMHARGRDLVLSAELPRGTRETLLTVGNYSFDWQRIYRWDYGAKHFPRGTRLVAHGRFDNSRFNPYNPDAQRTVRYGQSVDDEMMLCRVLFTRNGQRLNLRIDPSNGRVLRNP
jgi:mono/diheme cytochrome c family protein